MSTWKERLKVLLLGSGGTGRYDVVMRRSVQSVIMYEAQRCVKSKLQSLRPFQRKIAFLDQANALLDTLDFIEPHHRAEIMWRTGTSREPMGAEIAWKRSRLLEKELTGLAEKIKPYIGEGMLTHQQACNAMVKDMYETVAKEAPAKKEGDDQTIPANWEHSHNNCLLAFRLYYKFSELDPDFPAPVPPVPIVVPSEKPSKAEKTLYISAGQSGTQMSGGAIANTNNRSMQFVGSAFAAPDPIDERSKVLQEVREHLDLLKEFEGIIPEEEIATRKRELFAALPPAPPPFEGKRMKI